MYWLYTLLATLLIPLALIRLYFLGKKNPLYRQRIMERLGYVPFQLEHCIWFHCVSLGESIAATPLIKKMLEYYGPHSLLVTTITPTGSEHIKKIFTTEVYHCYFPYDHPLILKRFIRQINPRLLILMETELWPQVIRILHQQNVPIILTNARLSERSKNKYARFGLTTTRLLRQLSCIAAQTISDAKRFEALGMLPTRIIVTGNLKYDAKIPAEIIHNAEKLRANIWPHRLVWIAGSTHEGEEKIILAAHQKILEAHPEALLILVPRHVDRIDQIEIWVKSAGFSVQRRSQGTTTATPSIQVYLGDTFGEMLLLYGVSDLAFVGGSLIMRGGHNLLEPASLAKPCLSGPHTFNFTQITELLSEAKGLTIVHNAEDLASAVIQLMNQPEHSKKMGQKALRVVEDNRGALDHQLKIIQQYCPKNKGGLPP